MNFLKYEYSCAGLSMILYKTKLLLVFEQVMIKTTQKLNTFLKLLILFCSYW